jgi:hypothetical protein
MTEDQSNRVHNSERVTSEQKLTVRCRTTITVGKLKNKDYSDIKQSLQTLVSVEYPYAGLRTGGLFLMHVCRLVKTYKVQTMIKQFVLYCVVRSDGAVTLHVCLRGRAASSGPIIHPSDDLRTTLEIS